MNQSDALEVAKLAAMVGGQLRTVDQYTTHGTNNPANKLDINTFIAKVKNPNASIRPASYLTDAPAGFAPAPPEDYVQNIVPDTSIGSDKNSTINTLLTNIDQIPVSSPIASISSPQVNSMFSSIVKPEQEAPKIQFREDIKPLLTRSDIDSIRNSLKNIDKSLSGMLKCMQQTSKPQVNE
jgi:hypothetical protein